MKLVIMVSKSRKNKKPIPKGIFIVLSRKIVFEQVRQKDFNLDTSHLDRSKVKGVKQVWSKEKSASVQESEQEGQFAKKGIQPRGQVRAKKFVQTQVSTPINSSAPPIPALPEDNPDEAIDKQRSLGIEE